MRLIFGVDIGGTTIKFGKFTEELKLLEKWSVETDLSDYGAHIVPQVAEVLSAHMKEQKIRKEEVLGIGMGIPGPVTSGGYVEKCVNLHWTGFNPVTELQKFFPGFVIRAENDANVASLGEYFQGAGRDASSMMMVTLGTGVGGGVILDGKILTGAHGIGGEIGHIATDPTQEETCNCGNKGCIDQCASATGIVRKAEKLLKSLDQASVLRELETLTAKEVCDGAREGDELSVRIIEECMYPLGVGLAHFSHAFDPEMYVIGGGVSLAGEVILDAVRKGYEAHLFLIGKGADIRLAELGNDAGVTGACALIAKE